MAKAAASAGAPLPCAVWWWQRNGVALYANAYEEEVER